MDDAVVHFSYDLTGLRLEYKTPVTPWHIGVAVTLQNRSSCWGRSSKFSAL